MPAIFHPIHQRCYQRFSDFPNAGGQKMSKIIHISDELYRRLEAYASGFDTPSNVIERILNAHEKHEKKSPHRSTSPSVDLGNIASDKSITGDSNTANTSEQEMDFRIAKSPMIIYISGSKVSSEKVFKQDLLSTKKAYVRLFYIGGEIEDTVWNALHFRRKSIVNHNLRAGYLKGWRQRGITKIVLSVNRDDLATQESITADSRIADFSEQGENIRCVTSLTIIYPSGSEEKFRQELLAKKRAYIRLFYTNKKTEDKVWNALHFRPTSIVDNNLRTGYLRKWRQRGIMKAVVSVNQTDLDDFSMDTPNLTNNQGEK